MAVKISIVEPSFKRSQMAVDTFKEWVNHADRPEEIEHIVALDSVDPTVPDYQTKFSQAIETTRIARFEINVGDSINANQAMNRAAKLTNPQSELLIMLSDDQGCFQHWDTELFRLLEGVDNFKDPKLIWPDDGYWEFGVILVYYFANRAFYNRVGFVINEEYSSMWGDNELMETGKILNAIIPAPHLKFQHRHYSKGYTPYDETYARRNNPTEFNNGMEVYNRRKAKNFGL
jgi:hypothetical protein